MSTVRISGALPADNRNGLATLANTLVEDPDQPHSALILFHTSKIVTDCETGDTIPTVTIHAIEPVKPGPDATELHRLLRRAFEKRTGQQELPLDLERAIDELGSYVANTEDVTEDPANADANNGGNIDTSEGEDQP